MVFLGLLFAFRILRFVEAQRNILPPAERLLSLILLVTPELRIMQLLFFAELSKLQPTYCLAFFIHVA